MREAYLGAAEMIANTSYNKEHVTAKCMFQRVKRDLVGGTSIINVTNFFFIYLSFIIYYLHPNVPRQNA